MFSNPQELAIYGLTMGSTGCAAALSYPFLSRWWMRLVGDRLLQYQEMRTARAVRDLDELFVEVRPRWLQAAYVAGPVAGGLIAYVFLPHLWALVGGVVLGVLLPDWWVKYQRSLRGQRFQGQLVDALFMMSSCLRAGLSLPQTFETLERDMTPPASQEFGLVVKAHRLGQPFETALESLTARVDLEEMKLITTAVLVALETGGDLTRVINQLVFTIREKKKATDKVKTLTLQGKLQAYLLSGLPIAFAVMVQAITPGYFKTLWQQPAGQVCVLVAAVLWVVGMVLLFRLSKVEV